MKRSRVRFKRTVQLRSLVPLMVVLVAAVGEARAQDRIKICGRDLIRLAVTSCGNSRVRRSILDADLAQRQYASHWGQDAFAEEHQATEAAPIPPESDGEKGVFSLAPHWYTLPSRIRRAAGTMSDICCEKGCSMKELIQFC
ncbi:insulin-like 3 (Leydig cell) isoform X3 [Perca flavescens]|uniref:insulin-like 3 (Leydig cell) isoform X3 n=1 Tax=Perca flavescens TaxID=8167 RepID=UPI00106EF017|nr:relaxin-3-like isoform X3 [Perca flavescens]